MYYKEKYRITKSIYNLYVFYKSDLLKIIKIEINNTLILINNNFVNNKKIIIKVVKIMIKNCKSLIFIWPIKFNKMYI